MSAEQQQIVAENISEKRRKRGAHQRRVKSSFKWNEQIKKNCNMPSSSEKNSSPTYSNEVMLLLWLHRHVCRCVFLLLFTFMPCCCCSRAVFICDLFNEHKKCLTLAWLLFCFVYFHHTLKLIFFGHLFQIFIQILIYFF